MTRHGVTQRGRTPTPSSLTITSLTHTLTLFLLLSLILLLIPLLTIIAQDTAGCLRTLLAKANICFQSWWQNKTGTFCVETTDSSPSPLCISVVYLLSPVKSYGQSQKHQTCAANKPRVQYRHKSDTASFLHIFHFFLALIWMGNSPNSASLWLWHIGTTGPTLWFMITTKEEKWPSQWSSLFFIQLASV